MEFFWNFFWNFLEIFLGWLFKCIFVFFHRCCVMIISLSTEKRRTTRVWPSVGHRDFAAREKPTFHSQFTRKTRWWSFSTRTLHWPETDSRSRTKRKRVRIFSTVWHFKFSCQFFYKKKVKSTQSDIPKNRRKIKFKNKKKSIKKINKKRKWNL